MASKASRWAVSEEDAARAKQEREARRRLKSQKTARRANDNEGHSHPPAQLVADGDASAAGEDRPAKRRKVTPAPEVESGQGAVCDRTSTTADGGAANGIARGHNRPPRLSPALCGKCRSVENYDKLNDIEEGAYGWVARARELATGNIVALKRLKLDPKDRNGLPVTGLREIQILKNCSHPNVVGLREVVVGEDTSKIESIFLVLDFVEHDLKSILEDMPEPFLASEVKTLLLQLAAGVDYLHDNWVLHRDLKSSNLLLNNRGQLKIADFGMARDVGDPSPQLTQLVVTLWYRAPELLLGADRYGRAVDMWSVGCIFGELLAREPVLQGKNEADELARIFDLCGVPSDETWPGFRRLPNARPLRLPKASPATGSKIRAKFPLLTAAGCALMTGLLSLDPDRRLTAKAMLAHEYFRQDPKPKQQAMFPTFPSKAGQERRKRRDTPNAPVRGQAASLGAAEFSGIFGGIFGSRDREERGAGFSLRMA